MYPSKELTALAERKAVLQARIGLRRQQCVEAAEDLAPQIALAAGVVGRVQQLSSLTKRIGLPMGLNLIQSLAGKAGLATKVLSFLPGLFGGGRSARPNGHARAP
jgi:hypothetical protein